MWATATADAHRRPVTQCGPHPNPRQHSKMNPKLVAITGTTGELGREVAERVAQSGLPMRLLVRDSDRAPQMPNTDVREASYEDVDAFATAVSGADTVFLVSLPESEQRRALHRSAIDACRQAGVNRIVYTSFTHPSPDAVFTLARDHYDTEQALESSGIPFTALRNNLYIEMIPTLVTAGVIRGPAGDGQFAPVARTDVAAVAARVIVDGFENNQRLEVSGPERIDLHHAAALMSEITGQPVGYINETMDEAFQSRAHLNATRFEIEAWISSYTSIAAGEMSNISDTVAKLTGRPAQTPRERLTQYLSTATTSC
ncbi:Quinone oxidoreductase 2 [Crateriforma conspicua]|nr:Quinone oxidoreductase 2 [Crateriforma conspicua]